ncbi:hypothetical protein H0266_17000 [Halobacillus locisalis]|uniref:Uncharacterized protein n=1 Tax=Halobacillus locisalis TaxID=220753 RepID=A0A838CXD1_9BACI|nr:hypothetical protein [Halobacillus locisalis]MBA2176588.1 hypothetical protein [Halobacillus locisalis]
MFNRKKQLLQWEDIRKKGKWRFFLVYGVLLMMPIYLGVNLLYNAVTGTEERLRVEIINAIIFGIIYSGLMWWLMERRYQKQKTERH